MSPQGSLTVIHAATGSNSRQNVVDILLDLAGAHSTAGRRLDNLDLLLPDRFLRYRRFRGKLNTFTAAQNGGTRSGQGCHFGLLDLDVAFATFANSGRSHFRRITLLLRNGLLLF